MRPGHRLPLVLVPTLTMLVAFVAPDAAAQDKKLWVGPNVNMVSGTTWPDGDPFLQRQNEPSIAVSTRNTMHLVGFANDYRSVDLPGLPEGKETGDAWLGVFHSLDGGLTWRSNLLRGYPQDQGSTSPLWGYDAAADPVVRAGTQGMFYLSGIAFDRGDVAPSAVFVSRSIDLNNLESGDPITYIDTKIVKSNAAGSPFIDKPWIAVDVPRVGAQSAAFVVQQNGMPVEQIVNCGNVYLAWAEIQGVAPNRRSAIMFSRSRNCGTTWDPPLQLSAPDSLNQGVTMAVSPTDGHVWVAWRQFDIDTTTSTCAFGGGYWKSHPSDWPVATVILGATTYTKSEALKILKNPRKGDATYILAVQLIPAKLNVAAGVSDAGLQAAIDEADAWLVSYPLGSNPSSGAARDAALALEKTLKAYNEGLLTADGCTSSTVPTSTGNAMVAMRSTDFGASFSSPAVVAPVYPFEQGTSPISFRTNAYPTITVGSSPNEPDRAYLAWTTRGEASPRSDPVEGDGRIVVSTSLDAANWTQPKPIPIDQPGVPGHQLQPSISFAGGKVTLAYYDLRRDYSGLFERFIADWPSLDTYRHTVDVRVAQADPGPEPVFTDYTPVTPGGDASLPSDQVSRYLFVPGDDAAVVDELIQFQFNPPNLPIFVGGTRPFFGDYIDLGPTPAFVPDGAGGWKHNTLGGEVPVFHAVWTDNRDVEAPHDGNWSNYVPPTYGNAGDLSIFDPNQTRPTCETTPGGEGQTRIRNQNIYTARISNGLVVGSPGSSRLASAFQRAHVVFVRNDTLQDRFFRMEFAPLQGAMASFEQFEPVDRLELEIPGSSSAARTVFVTSGDGVPTVRVNVFELDSLGGSPVSGGLTSSGLLNPDPTNPAPADPGLVEGETYDPVLLGRKVTSVSVEGVVTLDDIALMNLSMMNLSMMNLGMMNLSMMNLGMMNLSMMNLGMMNLGMMNLGMMNPALSCPSIYTLGMMNPALTTLSMMNLGMMNLGMMNLGMMNLGMMNASVTDVTWEVTNSGTTTAAYSFNMAAEEVPEGLALQLVAYRVYETPVADGCALVKEAQHQLLVNVTDPDFSLNLLDPGTTEPDPSRVTFWVAPDEWVYVTLRVLDSDEDAGEPFEPADVSAAVVAQPVDTEGAEAGDTQPSFDTDLSPTVPPLVITTATLPNGVVGSAYATTLTAEGGSGPRAWGVAPGSALPSGLSLSPAGILSGAPTAPGSFSVTFRVTDYTQMAERTLVVEVLASILSFIEQPSNVIAGRAMSPVQVQALANDGSPIAGLTITMTLGTAACSGSTLSGGASMVTGLDGVASFSTLSIDRGGYGYALSAAAPGAPTITSAAFDVEGFCLTASLGGTREEGTATLLPTGKVLIAGGRDGSGSFASALLYNPAAGTFSPTGDMGTARSLHAATLLADGRVLITGGIASPATTLNTAELYDPATGLFTPTGTMDTPRWGHTSTLLPDSRVLIVGGGSPNPVELYDPSSGTFTVVSDPPAASVSPHTATLLPSGKVLFVWGGWSPAHLFDPFTSTFSATGSLAVSRRYHAAALLPSGKALIVGGSAPVYPYESLASIELFDPSTGSFSLSAVSLSTSREEPTVIVLPSGNVLVEGGSHSPGDGTVSAASPAEIYDPILDLGYSVPDALPRYGHTASLLPDGTVLIAGGFYVDAELFFPLPPTTFMVTNTADSGTGSLRQAILDASMNPGRDAIHFNIPGSGVHTISLNSSLPNIWDPVILDATTQPGYAGTPLIELDGSAAGSATGITIGAGSSVVRGLVINRFNGSGIVLWQNGRNLVEGNFIGTDPTGTLDLGNSAKGIGLLAVNNMIGGTAAAARNVISGNGDDGILIRGDGNVVQGNFVGTDATGTAPLGNGHAGIWVLDVHNNLIGGATAGAGNLISGNGSNGITVEGDVEGTVVAGNWIGTNGAGTAAIGNNGDGIGLYGNEGFDEPVVRNATVSANIIAGSVYNGIRVTHGYRNAIRHNWIGTNAALVAGLGNGDQGISLAYDNETTVGGTDSGDSNVVAYNGDGGIGLESASFGANIVGNVVSGNFGPGIGVVDSQSMSISGNLIGTDPAGTTRWPNTGDGISIAGVTLTGITIGGAAPGAGNVIAANGGAGVSVNGGSGNVIQGNWIGTNAALASGLGNVSHGVSGGGWLVGGADSAAGNVIANNLGSGVAGELEVLSNTIFGNGVLGIDVAANGVIEGYPEGWFIPVIESAIDDGSATVVSGTVRAGWGFGAPVEVPVVVQLFANDSCEHSTYGEGRTLLASAPVVTVGSNITYGTFVVSLPPGLGGKVLTATNTIYFLNGYKQTYEFSACVSVSSRILWVRQYGTANSDAANEISVDASGVYVAGYTTGTLPGQTSAGGSDAFVHTFDADGNESWTRQFGTASSDTANAISLGPLTTYVAGSTQGALPSQSGAGGYDAFVRTYDPAGTELWTRQFGTAWDDYAKSICVDASGPYVAGYTSGTLPGQASAGNRDAFVRHYDLAGNEAWTRQFGTASGEDLLATAVDASGVYVAGYTTGTLPGQTSSGGEDAFVRKYDLGGNELWTRQFGSAEGEDAMAAFVDGSGVYVTGFTNGILPGQSSSGNADAFVRKYDSTGIEVWTRQFGGADGDASSAISVDASGVYIAGSTFGALPGWTSSGGRDAFVRKYDLAGNELWTLQFGTTGEDGAFGISVDASGVIVVGFTDGTLPGQTSAGGTDVFIMKLVKD